jgi:PilZ domain
LLFFADRQGVSEKRTEQRIPLMARVDILWMDNELTPRVAPATLEDRSRSGVSLRMKNSISLGSHITIKSGTIQYSGIVTNCRRDKGGFIIGVKLDTREEPGSK